MDYSTISNKTAFTEADEMTNGELSEQYYLLKKQYENLSNSYDILKQELHDTNRNYMTAVDIQSHLNAELEGYQAEEKQRKNELSTRIVTLQEEITLLREERSELSEKLANDSKKHAEEIRILKEERAFVLRASPEHDTSELDEARAAVTSAMSDAAAARAALEEATAEVLSWKIKAEELVAELGEMREAANMRREELKAVEEREAAALADLAEARAMLHQCTDAQDLQPHAAKGNSLFAEVEDKRQEMAKNLIQMKQTNSRLKRELANKQAELDTLLHEKHTIWEQQAGASAQYDKELIESYEDRITQLESLCETQRRELARWFGRLCEPTEQGWLPGVLEHLKSECAQLRAEVVSRGAAQLASAAQLREARGKLVLAHRPPHTSPLNKEDIPTQRTIAPTKKLTPTEAKKKVVFN